MQSREYWCISSPFLPFICLLTPASSAYTLCTPRKPNTPSTKIQFKSAAILPISTTPLPSPIATNTTSTSRPMLVNHLLEGSGPSLDTKTRNFSATTAIKSFSSMGLLPGSWALVQFNPIPINFAATVTLLPNSSFPREPEFNFSDRCQSPRFPFPRSPPRMPHTILTRLSRFVFHSRALERGLGVSGWHGAASAVFPCDFIV